MDQPPKYKPPELRENPNKRRNQYVALFLAIILILVGVFVFLAYDEKYAFLISMVIALIPPIVALMPQPLMLDYADSEGKKPQDENRAKMLYSVYRTWIEGALRPNLPAGVIDLGLGLQPDAVLHRANYDDYKLPDSSHDILQVFDDMRGELLILGEPGSGKTILMLQLAEQLLGRAQTDDSQPIPAVFNLSSWSRNQPPLETWLVDELKRSYGVQKKTAQRWIENGELVLLLDGLDEIGPSEGFMPGIEVDSIHPHAIELRTSLMEKARAYQDALRVQDIDVRIVVCSRTQEYEAIREKLDLNAAVEIQPLTSEQISGYLEGDRYSGIRDLLRAEPVARIMGRKPLLLTIMKETYAGRPYTGSPHNELKLNGVDEGGRRRQLLDEYTRLKIAKSQNPDYQHANIRKYMNWLAAQMILHEKTVFYIEDLQPGWIAKRKQYRLLSGLIFRLIEVEFAEKTSWSVSGENLRNALLFGLIGGLLFGLLFG
ncbi:MAG: NACHT domain-containing protein, partial [Anaerolineae bacterium]|nr:NACHT domain-containing protein [Anaerolineae bacterium]